MHESDAVHEAVAPTLRALEIQRVEVVDAMRKATVTAVVLAVAGAGIGALAGGQGALFGLVAGAVVGGLVYHVMCGGKVSAYKRHFKVAVVREILARSHPELHYTPDGGLPQWDFVASNLFSAPDRFSSEDGFRGRIGDTEVRFSEVKAEERRRDKNRTYYVTIFDGIFMVADFHKEFRGTVRVVPDTAEKILGFLGKALQSFRPLSDEKLVYLEDPEFEKEFAVYGTDQVEARYILSTSLVGRILDLRAKWADSVRLAFSGSEVYIAIAHSKDLLEPNLRRPADDREQILRFADELSLCLSVVEDLNLNTRIWTKG